MRSVLLASCAAFVLICHLADSAFVKRVEKSVIAERSHAEITKTLGHKFSRNALNAKTSHQHAELKALLKTKTSGNKYRQDDTCPDIQAVDYGTFGLFLFPLSNENTVDITNDEAESSGQNDDGDSTSDEAGSSDQNDGDSATDEAESSGQNNDGDSTSNEAGSSDQNDGGSATDEAESSGQNNDGDSTLDEGDLSGDSNGDSTTDVLESEGRSLIGARSDSITGAKRHSNKMSVKSTAIKKISKKSKDVKISEYEMLINLIQGNVHHEKSIKRSKRYAKANKDLNINGIKNARQSHQCSKVIQTARNSLTVIVMTDECSNGQVQIYNGVDNSSGQPTIVPCGQSDPTVFHADGSVYIEYNFDSSQQHGGFGLFWVVDE